MSFIRCWKDEPLFVALIPLVSTDIATPTPNVSQLRLPVIRLNVVSMTTSTPRLSPNSFIAESALTSTSLLTPAPTAPPMPPVMAPTSIALPRPSFQSRPSKVLEMIVVAALAPAPTIAPPTIAPARLLPSKPPTAPTTSGPMTSATTSTTTMISTHLSTFFHRG